MTEESARLRTVEAANALENISLPKSRIKAICLGKAEPQTENEHTVLGFYSAYSTVISEYESMPARLRYVQQLHRELFSHVRGVGGNFKKTNESITAIDAFGNEIVLFTPTAPYETPGAIDEICNKFNRAESDGALDPLLLIPMFVLDFLSIRPFSEGNERVSSLITSLLLLRSGYSIVKYISIDALILSARAEYFNALRKSQLSWNEGREDATPFIKFFLTVLKDAYLEFEDRIDILGNKMSALDTVRRACERARDFTKAEMQTLCPNLSKT
jgi:Fic family protein